MAAERGHHDAACCRLYHGICYQYLLLFILYEEVASLTVLGRHFDHEGVFSKNVAAAGLFLVQRNHLRCHLAFGRSICLIDLSDRLPSTTFDGVA